MNDFEILRIRAYEFTRLHSDLRIANLYLDKRARGEKKEEKVEVQRSIQRRLMWNRTGKPDDGEVGVDK